MADYDASIRIHTDMDSKEIQKAQKEIDQLEKKLDKLYEKGEKLEALGVSKQSKQWQGLRYDVAQTEVTLEDAREKLLGLYEAKDGKLTSGFQKAKDAAKNLFYTIKDGAKKSQGLFSVLARTISRVAVAAFVFNQIRQLFTKMVASMKEGFRNLAKYSTEYNQAMSGLKSQCAQLKNSLAVAFAPIVTMIIPYLTRLVSMLNTACNAIAQFFAVLAGKSTYTKAKKQVVDYAKSLGTASKAAKGALAAFDDLNVLDKKESSSGGGEVSGANAFEEAQVDEGKFKWVEWLKEHLKEILTYVEAIGVGILAWKIASLFIEDLDKLIGIAMFAAGAFLLIKNAIDAWQNGVSWKNLRGMVLGAALAIGGMALAFGPLVAGITAIIAGIIFLVVGIHDMIENGINLKNSIMAIIGVFLTLSAVFGAVAGVIGGIVAGLVLAIAADWDNFKKTVWEPIKQWAKAMQINLKLMIEGVKDIFHGLIKFFKGVFTGDWKMAWEGVKQIASGFFKILTGLGEDFAEGFQKIFGGIAKFIKGIFTRDWKLAWEGVKDVFAGMIQVLGALVKKSANFFIGIINTVVNAIAGAINAIVAAINKINFKVPDWIPGLGGKEIGFNLPTITPPNIPYLAKGAVIPPKHPFLAMLGDQTNGTNIEAPLSTIEQGLQNVLERNGNVQNVQLTLKCSGDMAQLVRVLRPYIQAEDTRVGIDFQVQ